MNKTEPFGFDIRNLPLVNMAYTATRHLNVTSRSLLLLKTLAMVLLCLLYTNTIVAQTTIVEGRVTDAKTGEGIAFAGLAFSGTTMGTTTDFNGYYIIETSKPADSLRCTFVGYDMQTVFIKRNQRQTVNFILQPTAYDIGVVEIRPGENPAHILLRKIIEHKPENDKSKFETYEYETYNKLQFDLNNFTEKISKRKALKQISFIFDNVDTSETGKAYLPVFITETVSDVYFQKNPLDKKEIVKASRVSGLKNESVSQFLGDMYQNLDIYDNSILLFDKNFVSPISNSGLLFYKYYLTDSTYMGEHWCYKVDFTPRFKQDLTFTGFFWVADTSFAIKKIQFQLNKDANLNFVKDFFVQQEYERFDGKYWMRTYEKVVADFNPLKTGTMGMYGRKTTYYRNIKVNQPIAEKALKGAANIEVRDDAMDKDDTYWANNRPDSLTKAEQTIYNMVDTIKTLPIYRNTVDLVYGFITGYLKAGPLELGPYYSIMSFNQLEGNRFRFGMRTSNKFSTRLELGGYGAYGLRDKEWKYYGGFRYMIGKRPRRVIGASYRHDVELLGLSNTSTVQLNIIASVGRRRPLDQLIRTTYATAYYEHEWFQGFSNTLTIAHKEYNPAGIFRFERLNPDGTLTQFGSIKTSEVTLTTYFAYDEKYVSGEFDRTSLGTRYPKLTLTTTFGFKGVLGSDFQYQKLKLNIDDRFRINPLGYTDYNIEIGKIFGKVPYPLLNIQTGNETFAYSSYYFNMANFYEFATDQYLRLFVTHHFDGLLFNKIPLFRKLKWREVATFKGVIGNVSAQNRSVYQFPSLMYDLGGKPYMEAGVGIENIFKVFRVDVVWRLTHLDHAEISKIGIRGALQVTF